MKSRKCKICSIIFDKKYPLQFVCSPKCAAEYGKRSVEKKSKSTWSEEKKIIKDKLKKLGDWKKDLQVEINTIVRLIDKGHPCISSNSLNGKMNAGHYVGVKAHDSIRYNLHNIHIQSEYSNSYLSGDTLRYQDGLRKVYGNDYFERVESLRATPLIKLSINDIIEKIATCREIVRELKKVDLTYPAKIRIELRESLNKRIGIY